MVANLLLSGVDIHKYKHRSEAYVPERFNVVKVLVLAYVSKPTSFVECIAPLLMTCI